ncbi:YphA family membrane protein [Natribacillus halophilus]|uniref:Energy-coupling factor transport system substrate-specific component n=1 Tax=Natribacillus halophilus TaxID=549003 RepID=A0A1G8JDY9_9BACI|nr:hypothetical protein [Natribacillus halophilus]SDI29273.1 hypothetical protein SAMN04488123_101173 [Natribacillus halophilus]
MDYALFFWLAWMLWIIVAFFMRTSAGQGLLAATILATIICAPMTFTEGPLQMSAAYGIVMLLACGWAGSLGVRHKWKFFLSAVALMFLYASFQLMIWYNPAFFLLGEVWLSAVVLAFLTVFICSYAEGRYPLILLAFCFGELIGAITVMPLTGGLYLADTFFYNVLTAVLMLIVAWHALEVWAYKLTGTRTPSRHSPGRLSL